LTRIFKEVIDAIQLYPMRALRRNVFPGQRSAFSCSPITIANTNTNTNTDTYSAESPAGAFRATYLHPHADSSAPVHTPARSDRDSDCSCLTTGEPGSFR
jgi:hypothetical protein